MDDDTADLPRVLEAHELPRLPCICRLVGAATDDHVAANGRASCSHPNNVWIRFGDIDSADGPGRNLAVTDGCPVGATVLRLPHAAARRAHEEGARLAAYA